MKRAVAYHGSLLTILWVSLLFFMLASFYVVLSMKIRLDRAEAHIAVLETAYTDLATSAVPVPAPAPPVTLPTNEVMPPTSTGSAAVLMMSPSGALDRGMMNASGTRYAGYNDTVKGKIGVAVEVKGESRPRYIVIFNPYTESTGKGTSYDSQMSVRWVDDSTIEYDVLVTNADKTQKIETRTVQIYF